MNKNKSKTLGKLLKKEGINIQYMINWENNRPNSGKDVIYTDQPHLGSASEDGKEGWYFRKDSSGDWSNDEKKIIKKIIKSKGYKVGHISDSEVEYDNDRTYPASVTFFKVYG